MCFLICAAVGGCSCSNERAGADGAGAATGTSKFRPVAPPPPPHVEGRAGRATNTTTAVSAARSEQSSEDRRQTVRGALRSLPLLGRTLCLSGHVARLDTVHAVEELLDRPITAPVEI